MKSATSSVDDRKLIDRLRPDASWGDCLGFWATTYEFQGDFFETDFLPSLLGLGAWDDKHWTSRIAMERKLALMEGAAVLLDAANYRARPRSLRLDVVARRAGLGVKLHAKVLLVVYDRAIQLLIGSANLTENGYRLNREAAIELAIAPGDKSAVNLIRAAIEGSEAAVGQWFVPSVGAINQHAIEVIGRLATEVVQEHSQDWFAWSGPGNSLLEQFLGRWPIKEQVTRLTIVSPFWSDSPEPEPLGKLLARLQEAGCLNSGAEIVLCTDAKQVGPNRWLPVLPESYSNYDFRKLGVDCFAIPVDPTVKADEVMIEGYSASRALHAKLLVMEGTTTALTYVGSANFTNAGWSSNGSAQSNIEAGVISRRSGAAARAQVAALLPATVGARVCLDGGQSAKLAAPPAIEPSLPWPEFLLDARLSPGKSRDEGLKLQLQIEPSRVRGRWELLLGAAERGDQGVRIFSREAADGRTQEDVLLSGDQLGQLMREQEIWVCWWANPSGSAFPINVDEAARAELPVSQESRDITEGQLIDYYQGKIAFEDLFPPFNEMNIGAPGTPIPVDPQVVDTSRIQSYQVRDFVEALEGIRDDLRAASGNPRAMRLALHGPVSPVALARLIKKQLDLNKKTPVAGAFELVEILVCLRETATHAKAIEWRVHIEKAVAEVYELLKRARKEHPAQLGRRTVFDEYQRRIVNQAAFGESI